MLKVFLSSTSLDLKEARRAAFEAICQLDEFGCVRMEDFGARELPPIEFCIDQVRECDIFVGIIGLRFGSCPEGETRSYTECEYDTALEIGLPRMIFLSSDEPQANDAAESSALEQIRFRQRLVKDQTCARFEGSTDLALKVGLALANWQANGTGAHRRRSPHAFRGPLLSKLCDRQEQFEQFSNSLVRATSGRRNRPQLFAIHGPENECHGSLVDRLVLTSVEEYARKWWGKHRGAIEYKDVEWPSSGPRAQESLAFNLLREFEPHPEIVTDLGELATMFSDKIAAQKKPVVVLRHELRFRGDWSRFEELFLWYLDLWEAIGQINLETSILVFFCAITDGAASKTASLRGWWSRLTAQRSVERFCRLLEVRAARAQKDGSSCLLQRLQPVLPADVMTWFSRYSVVEEMADRIALCEDIFGERSARPMADVEAHLHRICSKRLRT